MCSKRMHKGLHMQYDTSSSAAVLTAPAVLRHLLECRSPTMPGHLSLRLPAATVVSSHLAGWGVASRLTCA